MARTTNLRFAGIERTIGQEAVSILGEVRIQVSFCGRASVPCLRGCYPYIDVEAAVERLAGAEVISLSPDSQTMALTDLGWRFCNWMDSSWMREMLAYIAENCRPDGTIEVSALQDCWPSRLGALDMLDVLLLAGCITTDHETSTVRSTDAGLDTASVDDIPLPDWRRNDVQTVRLTDVGREAARVDDIPEPDWWRTVKRPGADPCDAYDRADLAPD